MSGTEIAVQGTVPGGAAAEERWPHWADEFSRLIAVRPQFVLSGNIRDVYLTPTVDGTIFLPLVDCLFERLARRGCQCLFVYDHVDGVRVHPEDKRDAFDAVGIRPGHGAGGPARPEEQLPQWLRAVAAARDLPCAFVVDYASRLVSQPQNLADGERALFAACEKLAHETRPLRAPRPDLPPPFNPIVWLVNRPNDLPDWFVVRNESIRTLTASLPDRDTRAVAAAKLAEGFADDQLQTAEREKCIGRFADLTEGETLRSMLAIETLAREQGVALARVSDAVRLYKLGLPDNPWKKAHLRDKLRRQDEVIGRRVRGQNAAVRKSMDILIRSAMGLSGAQAADRGGRPRGVLFFAGPTGVGKTELAKAITELIFGDEQAYRRFDMSEFSLEQSEARLIGSPPGYVGHDAGGELVNAVRERPFSVLLFDEIEKAHPRILDKFLQILEDGRLTDGRGETVHFSEAVIIFTSNLGIYGENDSGARTQHVKPGAPAAEVEAVVRRAIEDHFRYRLERPEILNRIGDNIVVFNFIDEAAAHEIYDLMLKNVLARVDQEHSIALSIVDEVSEELRDRCTDDLGFGGRGIGNRLETAFINPLAVALFDLDALDGGGQGGDRRRITVSGIVDDGDGGCRVVLEQQ